LGTIIGVVGEGYIKNDATGTIPGVGAGKGNAIGTYNGGVTAAAINCSRYI